MSTTTNPVTSVESYPLTHTIVWSAKRRVNHGATIGTTSSGYAETVTENMQTLMSTGGGSLSRGLQITGMIFCFGGTISR